MKQVEIIHKDISIALIIKTPAGETAGEQLKTEASKYCFIETKMMLLENSR